MNPDPSDTPPRGLIRSTLVALIIDTFRQAIATRMFWLILGVTAVCVAVCASVTIPDDPALRVDDPAEFELYDRSGQPLEGPNPDPGRVTVLFGAIDLPLFRDGDAQVHHLQSLLAVWVAGAIGTVLALIWTSGFLPDSLQPASVAILLAKPVPRWALLLGRYLGGVGFVTIQGALFVVGTWAALGVATGRWSPTYLISLPLLVLQFASLYAVATLAAVWTRNAGASLSAALAVWLVGAMTNAAHHAMQGFSEIAEGLQAERLDVLQPIAAAGYWIFPKPADLVAFLDAALGVSDHLALPGATVPLDPLTISAVLASQVVFAGAVLVVAAGQFAKMDY